MSEPLSPYALREYRPGDEQEILASFNRIFAAVDPSFTPRTMEFWRWQFLDNPSGSRILLAATPEGRVVGQFAAVVQRMSLEGDAALFSQGVDHMSDSAYRRGLKRGSLLALLGNTIAELHGGAGPERDTLMWGAPVPAAWRVGKTFVRYEMIRTQLKLVADTSSVQELGRGGARLEVEEVQAFPDDVCELFGRAAQRHGAIAVRDKAQLDWRYVAHPERDYRIGIVRSGRALLGYAVFGRGSFDGQANEGLVCDWLADEDRVDVADALRAWLAESARALGCERLTAVFPDTVAAWLDFQRAGFRAFPTRYFIIGRQYVRGYDMAWMHRHWYYTLGDTDLV